MNNNTTTLRDHFKKVSKEVELMVIRSKNLVAASDKCNKIWSNHRVSWPANLDRDILDEQVDDVTSFITETHLYLPIMLAKLKRIEAIMARGDVE